MNKYLMKTKNVTMMREMDREKWVEGIVENEVEIEEMGI